MRVPTTRPGQGPSLASLLVAALLLSTAPVTRGDTHPIPRGEELLGNLNCTACHAADEALVSWLRPDTPPSLDAIASRVTPDYLRAFLADPHGVKPRTAMPDLLAGMDAAQRASSVDALVHYLASRGASLSLEPLHVPADELDPGRTLYHAVGCVACHEPQAEAWELEVPLSTLAEMDEEWEDSPDDQDDPDEDALPIPPGTLDPPNVPLGDLARRTTVDGLAAYLLDPRAARPDGRMPDMGLDEREARAIALYLLRDQALSSGEPLVYRPGLAYEYYEEPFDEDPAPDFDALTPVRKGVAERPMLVEPRENHFGFRFRGYLEVVEAGRYTFFLASDDGSRLYVDGELLIAHDGWHAMNERTGELALEAGKHPIVVTMFENAGDDGLELAWKRAGSEREVIGARHFSHANLEFRPPTDGPFTVDADKAREGRRIFEAQGCLACHPRAEDTQPSNVLRSKPLADLDPRAESFERGCLSTQPQSGVPHFALDDADRAALREVLDGRAALAASASAQRGPDQILERSLARLNCYACHRRDDLGGPHPDRTDYFQVAKDVDLGPEGRIPPHLSGVGGKLRRSWIEAVLLEGKTARPYMRTRMPQFATADVAPLVDLFDELDAPREPAAVIEPTHDNLELGRRLVGTKGGLGCIQCHDFAGYESLGIPAVDLADVHARLTPGWFETLLLDPKSIGMYSRMPSFLVDGRSPVKDVLDGDPIRQAAAIWTYLEHARSMPMPAGLDVPESAFELTVEDRPVLCGVFMKDISPRTIAVGNPGHVHYAFDVENSRLARAWRGRFFNAHGTWFGRAGSLEVQPSEDAYDLPPGSPFAMLVGDAAWPEVTDRRPETRARGRRFDPEGRPSFIYSLGPLTIEEQPRAILRDGVGWLARRFVVKSESRAQGLWFRAALGKSIRQEEDGSWTIDRHVHMKFNLPEDMRPRMRRAGDQMELLVPMRLKSPTGGEGLRTEFEVQFTW